MRERVNDEAKSQALGALLPARLKGQFNDLSRASFQGIQAASVALIGPGSGLDALGLGDGTDRHGFTVSTTAIESKIDWTVNRIVSESIVTPEEMRSMILAIMGQ